MRVVVIGAGAIGGLIGATLARGGAEVVLLDKDEAHVAAINRDGLGVERDGLRTTHRLPATTDPAGVGVVDLAVVLVDTNATRPAAELARALIGADGAAITLQNGIGNIEILVEVLGVGRVIAGSTMNSAARLAPGRIAHTHEGKTLIGELDGKTTERVQAIVDLLTKGGLPVVATDNIQGHVWQKFVLNAGLNALCAITRLRPGEVVESEQATALARRILAEVLAVVRAEGVVLPEPDPTESILGHAVGRMNKPSMLQHVEQGRRTEIDAINGALLRFAEKHGLACPVNETIVQLVKAIEGRPSDAG